MPDALACSLKGSIVCKRRSWEGHAASTTIRMSDSGLDAAVLPHNLFVGRAADSRFVTWTTRRRVRLAHDDSSLERSANIGRNGADTEQ